MSTVNPERGQLLRYISPEVSLKNWILCWKELQNPPYSQGETVLVVEDEPSLLKLNIRMLEKLGYRVLPAHTPCEAMRLAEKHGSEIALLLTDIVMPEMNGRDLAERLQALYPRMKILFMSGYTNTVIADRGVLDEGVNFIQKLFSFKGLGIKIREALR